MCLLLVKTLQLQSVSFFMKTSLPKRRSIVSIQTNNLLPCLFLARVPNSHEKTITGLDVCRIRESIFKIIEANIMYIVILC